MNLSYELKAANKRTLKEMVRAYAKVSYVTGYVEMVFKRQRGLCK